jgi:DNA polymerase III epsilon subunit-like protein
MSKKREVFISVDIETAGPIVGEHSMLTIGACLAYTPETEFSVMLKPISDKAVKEALEVSGLSLEQAENEGLEPAEAMSTFAAWVVIRELLLPELSGRESVWIHCLGYQGFVHGRYGLQLV